MHLSRVEVSWGSSKNPYNLHRAIWDLFPGGKCELRKTAEESRNGFLFQIEKNKLGYPSTVLVQSRNEPILVSEHARVIATKVFNPQPAHKQYLSFVLVANPVKTILDQAERLNKKGDIKKCRVPLIKDDQQIEWLNGKLNGIARLDATKVHKLAPIFFYKQKEKCSGKLMPILFEGILQVIHPGTLVKVLEDGVGPGKAFGCGLMLVKRI